MKLFTQMRFLAVIVIYNVSMLFSGGAHAIGQQRPGIMDRGSADISQADNAITTIFNYAVYLAYGLGALTLVSGLIMCLQIVGQPEKGKTWLKTGAWVIVGAGVMHIVVAVLGGLFN